MIHGSASMVVAADRDNDDPRFQFPEFSQTVSSRLQHILGELPYLSNVSRERYFFVGIYPMRGNPR
jgi:hypothetical protein